MRRADWRRSTMRLSRTAYSPARWHVLVGLAPGVPPSVLLRMVIVWTQLFGMINFELFGQLVGSMDPADEFFASATRQMAAFVGVS